MLISLLRVNATRPFHIVNIIVSLGWILCYILLLFFAHGVVDLLVFGDNQLMICFVLFASSVKSL